jgi:molybdopterin molybdotransferase
MFREGKFMMNYPIGVSLEKGVELLLEQCSCVETEEISIVDALGRVLAKDQVSTENIPPFDRSPLDGYAVRAKDIEGASKEHPIKLTIIEEVPAGYAPTKSVSEGEAVKILTGAPMPQGADVVIRYEETVFDANFVEIVNSYPSGTNVVYKGEDIKIGDVVVEAQTKISAATVGLLAGLGIDTVCVYRKPRVAIISTGDELVPVSTKVLAPGKIRNSSMYAIKAFLNQYGVETVLCGIEPDDDVAIAQAIDKATEQADVVITTGGVSVGDYDMLGRAIERLQAKILFWKLQMKPGMAYLASVHKGKLVMSLSGNPGSASISLLMTGLPVFAKLSGLKNYQLKKISVCMKEGFSKKSKGRRFIPGRLVMEENKTYLSITPEQCNGMLHPLSGCQAIAVIDAGSPPVEAGAWVNAFLLDF